MESLPDLVESAINARLRGRQIHGLALAAFDADGILFSGGVGFSDLARGERVAEATVFRAASISKLLTSSLVLRLAELGLLDLDTPVNEYLPPEQRILDRTGVAAPIEIRQLLSHSSGLPAGVRGANVGNPALSFLANQGRVRTLEDAIAGLQVTHPPGSRVVYSNPAFNLLGFIAGRVAGRPFELAVREHVLGPLGMTNSAFTTNRSGPGIATPYGSILPPQVSSKPAHHLQLVGTAMGGLTTSATDLARFGRMILNNGVLGTTRLLSARTLENALTVQAVNHPELQQGFGLGFKLRRWRDRKTVGHDGNMPGVATQLKISPADGVGVVVLTNGFALGVPHEIADIALEYALALPPEREPGSPVITQETSRAEWESLGRRSTGNYQVLDASPPGTVGRLLDLTTRVRVNHEAGGRLRVDGYDGADGPMWLQPDGDLGHYVVASAVDNGSNAVLDERSDGTHIWCGYSGHLFCPRRGA